MWQPDKTAQSSTNMMRFMALVNRKAGLNLSDFRALHAYSVREPAQFWRHVFDFCGVLGSPGARLEAVSGSRFFERRFLPDARLNFAENLLAGGGYASKNGSKPALIVWQEQKTRYHLSWDELRWAVSRFRVHVAPQKNSRVAAILPNGPEAVIAMLGTVAEGAIWSSCSPDFGAQALLDRFSQIEPEILIACDGAHYNGKQFDFSDRLRRVVAGLPSLKQIIVVDQIGQASVLASQHPGGRVWTDVISAHEETPDRFGQKCEADFERFKTRKPQGPKVSPPLQMPRFKQFSFNHPLFILFSSGTTGAPKCILHGAGGTLLQHLKEHQLHCDLKPEERFFYYSTCGWMMWNWLVSGLASGATLILFDGAPLYPSGNILFEMCETEKVSVFGTSAKFIETLRAKELSPRRHYELQALRLLLSTGSPLSPIEFEYVAQHIKPKMPLASISGGTDIVSCFVLGNPLEPVRRGEIQGPGLGMDMDVVDTKGVALSGKKGELVCRTPFVSMPLGFWPDAMTRQPTHKAFEAAYFSRFCGLWHHGDYAEKCESGGYIIHGRSDATLNPGGVRIGTNELYSVIAQIKQISQSLAVGQAWHGDERIILFVVLAPKSTTKATDNEVLFKHIRSLLKREASPRHVPAKIIVVPEIPRTKSGKITEILVRRVIHGDPPGPLDALENPEALAHFKNLAALLN